MSKKKSNQMNQNEETELNMDHSHSSSSPVDVSTDVDSNPSEHTTHDPLVTLSQQLKEHEDKYLRLYAEFDNFRRRNAKERLELIQNAGSDIIVSLLPVLDDFNRSLKASVKDSDSLKEGVELVHRKLFQILESKGLKKMEVNGITFDPDFHEAITQIPVSDEKQKGQVVDVVEDGYMLNEKVLRFAKVIIGS
jgi:molecular chaperone GrpE